MSIVCSCCDRLSFHKFSISLFFMGSELILTILWQKRLFKWRFTFIKWEIIGTYWYMLYIKNSFKTFLVPVSISNQIQFQLSTKHPFIQKIQVWSNIFTWFWQGATEPCYWRWSGGCSLSPESGHSSLSPAGQPVTDYSTGQPVTDYMTGQCATDLHISSCGTNSPEF